MPNPFVMPVDIQFGPITYTFQAPSMADRARWDVIASSQSETTYEEVSELLWSLLKSTKIDGQPAPAGWEADLRESGLLNGLNGIEVGAKLFLFRAAKAVVVGLD